MEKKNIQKKKEISGVIIIAVILMTLIGFFILMGLTKSAAPEVIQGQAETTDYRVSSKVPSRVKELRVKEGDQVKKGDTLVILESPEIEAKLSQAEAAVSAAQAIDTKTLNGTRQELIQSAFAIWQKAKAGREIAQKTYSRMSRLFDQGVIPEQKRDESQSYYLSMLASEKAAMSQYQMAVNGAQKEDKQAAQAQVAMARGAVSEVNSYLRETVFTALADGEVTEIFPEIGELVGTGAPIMNIALTNDVWFTFNIREDLMPGISVGKKGMVFVPSLGRKVPVRITLVENVGNFASWKATKVLDGYDLKTIEVQAHPLNPSDIKGVCSGMTAVYTKS